MLDQFTDSLEMQENYHDKAARNSASVTPFVLPVRTASIRRMPVLTAVSKDAGSTTLSTSRRANSSRSSAGSSKAILEI